MAGKRPQFQVASTQPATSVADEFAGAPPAVPQAWPPPARGRGAVQQSRIPGKRETRYFKQDAQITREQQQFVQAVATMLKQARQERLPKGQRAAGFDPPGPNTVIRLALDVLMELAADLEECTGDEDADRERLLAAIRGRLR